MVRQPRADAASDERGGEQGHRAEQEAETCAEDVAAEYDGDKNGRKAARAGNGDLDETQNGRHCHQHPQCGHDFGVDRFPLHFQQQNSEREGEKNGR